MREGRKTLSARLARPAGPGALALFFLLSAARAACGAGDPGIVPRDISKNPEWFPRVYRPYLRLRLQPPDFADVCPLATGRLGPYPD